MFGFKAISVHKIVSAVVGGGSGNSGNLILSLTGNSLYNRSTNAVILDRSVNSAVVTRAGDAAQQVSSFSPFSSGSSYYFDGSGDYLSVPSNAAFVFGTGDFTVECWVYATTAPSDVGIFESRNGSVGSTDGFTLTAFSSSVIRIYSGSILISSSGTNYVNTWCHVAVVRQSGTLQLYINGVSQGTSSASLNMTNSDAIIGAGRYAGNSTPNAFFPGYISNFRIVKGTAVYTGNFTPSTSALSNVVNTSLLTCHAPRLFDGSVNNFDLTVAGNTSASTFSPFDKTALSGSISNSSVFFDGNGDYLSVPSSTGFDFGTGDFTIECWAYRTGAGLGDRFLVSRGNGANFLLRWNAAGNIQFYLNASVLVHNYTYAFPTNNWVHIAVTRSGTTSKMFINGTEVSSATNSTNVSNAAAEVLIGGYTSLDFFQGYISNVRIVKGTAVYTTAFTPPTSALTAVSGTSLLACDGVAITDNSSANATITVAGNAVLSTLNPFGNGTGWSGYFDGTGDFLTVPGNTAFQFGTGDFTVEGWWFTGPLTATPMNPVSYHASTIASGLDVSFGIYMNTTECTVFFYSGSTQYNLTGWSASVASNRWQHFALVRQSGTARFYLDGVQVGTLSVNASLNFNAAWQFRIGNYSDNTNRFWNGYLSNIRVIKGTCQYPDGTRFTPSTVALTAISGTSLLTLQDNTFKDNSSNSFALTRNGDIAIRGVGPFAEPNVWSGFFDGTGDYLSIARNATFFPAANTDFTIEAWVFLTATPGATNAQIVGAGEYGTDADWVLNINSSRTVQMYVQSTNVTYTGGTVALNTWNHIAVARSGTASNNFKIFVNGTGTSYSVNNTLVGVGSRALSIGADQNGDESNITGFISNLRIVNGTAIYTSNFIPPTAPLTAVAGTSLLTLQDNTFRDNSSNAFTITRFGDAIMRPHGPFAASYSASTNLFPGSIYFDGTNDYVTIPASASTQLLGGDFTIECWFNPISFNASGYNYLIFQDGGRGSTPGNLNFALAAGATGLVSFTSWQLGSRDWFWSITSTRALKLGAWNHIAVSHVRSSNTTRLFINGRLEATGTTSTWAGAICQTCLGNYSTSDLQTSTYAKLNGWMSGVRLVKGTALYTSGFVPPTTPPIATASTALLLNFNDGGVGDSYGSSSGLFTTNTGVVSNTVTKKYGTGSLYFPATYMVSAPHPDYALGTGDFTIEFWLNSTNGSNSSRGILNISSTAPSSFAPTNEGVGIKFASSNLNGLINFFIGGSVQTGTINATNAAWTHVALCRSAGTVRLFVGGVLSTKVASSTNITGQYLTLGAGGDGLAYPMTGYLDNFAIYKGYAKYTTDATFTPT